MQRQGFGTYRRTISSSKDREDCRGISLSSPLNEASSRSLLIIWQNGFRQGRSIVGQIIALRRLLDGVKGKNLSTVITFVDFKKERPLKKIE